MRFSEMLYFINKNPTREEKTLFTHVDIELLKSQINNYESRKEIRLIRRKTKNTRGPKTENIDIFE